MQGQPRQPGDGAVQDARPAARGVPDVAVPAAVVKMLVAIAVGRATASSIVRMPPRDVPTKIAGSASSAVATANTSASSIGIE